MALKGTLVFASGFSVNFDIWTLSLESGVLSRLTEGDDWHDSPRWSPDGSKIVYLTRKDDLVSSLWLMNRDGSAKQRLTNDISCSSPSWSPDGKSLLFVANVSDKSEMEVCSLSLEKGAEPEVLFKRQGVELAPCWSPCGQKIIFAGPSPEVANEPLANNLEVWEYDTRSQKTTRLSSNAARDYSPRYSPDGKRIAFVSHREGHNEGEYLRKVAELKSLAESGDLKSLNAGIKKVQELEKDSDIWIMNSDGSDAKQLTLNSGSDINVSWSPCGSYLVFTGAAKEESTEERLQIIDAENGTMQAFSYDRTALKAEMSGDMKGVALEGIFRKLTPDFIERLFVDSTIWGEERQPDWSYN